MGGLIGRKVGMTQVFDEEGRLVPVTVIQAGPCPVVGLRREDKEGYNALQLAYEKVKPSRVTKPILGIFRKVGLEPHRVIKEFRVKDPESYKVGQVLDVGMFQVGEKVKVTGWSKGRGFAGVVKRHGFAGGPKTHGQSDRWRAPGSIGASSDPSRVWKGMRMAGRMGNRRVTVRNLTVVGLDRERNLIWVKGAVPGARKGLVLISKETP